MFDLAFKSIQEAIYMSGHGIYVWSVVAIVVICLVYAFANYNIKIKKLIKKLSDINSEIDQQRLQQEVVYFLQKSDIEEELSRILSHNKEIIDLLKSKDPVGKKLDFMMQELNREANTLGSKSISTRISSLAVDIKVLIEQMREQIQNIE